MDKIQELLETLEEGREVLSKDAMDALFQDIVENSQYCSMIELIRIETTIGRIKRKYSEVSELGQVLKNLFTFFEAIIDDKYQEIDEAEKEEISENLNEYVSLIKANKINANLAYQKNKSNYEKFLENNENNNSKKMQEAINEYKIKMNQNLSEFYDYEGDLAIIDAYLAKTNYSKK